jgi:protein arginine kinase
MKQTSDKDSPVYNLKDLWSNQTHPIWLASLLNVRRNLAKMQFPAKLDSSRQEQVVQLIYDAVKSCPNLSKPRLLPSQHLNFIEKEFILEHFLLFDGFHQPHSGEGFIIDDSAEAGILINVQDHFQLNFMDTKQELEKSWNQLAKIEGHLGKSADFSFNPRFGYLTSDYRQCGTALTVTLFLHVPAIIHSGELPDLLERQQEDEITVCGLQGHSTEMIGDILVAKNRCTLGLTEEYILTSMRMWATKTVVHEVNARKKIASEGSESLKNKITRAFGLLTHAYQVEAIEALNTLSLVKLGTELGWIEAPKELNLTKILFNCRRAHLLRSLDFKAEIGELPKKRAEYLRAIAQQLKLNL